MQHDATIYFKFCRRVRHHKIQDKFEIGGHLHFLTELWPFFT